MELRGQQEVDEGSDGEDYQLPQQRRLGIGRLYQEGELGGISSSLNYTHSGILASGSAFRRPPLFPSPLSSSTQMAPSSHRPQYPQPPLSHAAAARPGSASPDDTRNPSAVQLPSSLDPSLSLVAGDRPEEEQEQERQREPQEGDAREDYPDLATPRRPSLAGAVAPAEGGDVGGSSSASRTEAATVAPAPTRTTMTPSAAASVRYRECLKNHAARVGGHVLDGCGEFMSGGEEGTPEALKCAACTCHRSFHRKEVEGGEEAEGAPLFLPAVSSASPVPPPGVQHGNPRRYYLPVGTGGNGAAYARAAGVSSSAARSLHNPPPLSFHGRHHHHQQQQQQTRVGLLPPSSGVTAAFGGGNDDEDNTNYSGGTTTTESSSEDQMQGHVAGSPLPPPPPPQQQRQYPVGSSAGKKRYRSKFTAEQKERMAGFAERVGWRMQKQDDAAVEQFCREVGVARQVFKVWMHNNKHTLLKSKQPPPPPPPPPPMAPPHHQQSSSSS